MGSSTSITWEGPNLDKSFPVMGHQNSIVLQNKKLGLEELELVPTTPRAASIPSSLHPSPVGKLPSPSTKPRPNGKQVMAELAESRAESMKQPGTRLSPAET